jgi:hypothetical protein
MSGEEMPRRRGFLFLTAEEVQELIYALEGQAVGYVTILKRGGPGRPPGPPGVTEIVRKRYHITLSLLTAALEYRANYYPELPALPRNDEAWSMVTG